MSIQRKALTSRCENRNRRISAANRSDRSNSGVMLEWLKRHAWKACIRQKRIGGSNPPHSARNTLKDNELKR